jgi:predicted transposase/invertase (TIGR01784 family)
MQMLWTDDFKNRIVFNAGKAYVRQLNKREGYHLLQPVYTLSILNENFDHKTEQFYHHYRIINRENTEEVIEGLEFVLVELSKFQSEKWSERRLASLWLQFLKEVGENMTALPEELVEDEQIRRALELCEEGAFTPEELAAYEAYWDMIRNEKTIREGSLARGRAEGEAIGLEKGEAERAKLQAEKEAAQAEKEAAQAENQQAQEKLEAAQRLADAQAERIANLEKLIKNNNL